MLKNRYAALHGAEEGGFLCWLLSFLGAGKCVYEKHSDAASYREGAVKGQLVGVWHWVERLTIRRADQIICTGPALAEQARAVANRGRIATIPDLPSSLLEPAAQQVSAVRAAVAPAGAVLVTYAGSFAEYQGLDIILEAIPMVCKAAPRIKFCIIGGSAQDIGGCAARLQNAGVVPDAVVFPGKVPPDDLTAWLAASDILLAPRKTGVNSPLKILDYFKAGGAIVATDTAANQRLLNEKCAVLCPFEAGAFAAAILKLSADPGRRAALSAQARRLYREQYNFPMFRDRLGKTYAALLAAAA